MNLTQWRETFFPLELGADFQMSPSQCRMYNVTVGEVGDFLQLPEANRSETPTITCRELNGYTYDQRWNIFTFFNLFWS